MEVGPKNAGVDDLGCLQQVVVIVPPRPQQGEAEEIAEEGRNKGSQVLEAGALRRSQLQHHDRDDDGDDAVAERFEPALGHPRMLVDP